MVNLIIPEDGLLIYVNILSAFQENITVPAKGSLPAQCNSISHEGALSLDMLAL